MHGGPRETGRRPRRALTPPELARPQNDATASRQAEYGSRRRPETQRAPGYLLNYSSEEGTVELHTYYLRGRARARQSWFQNLFSRLLFVSIIRQDLQPPPHPTFGSEDFILCVFCC